MKRHLCSLPSCPSLQQLHSEISYSASALHAYAHQHFCRLCRRVLIPAHRAVLSEEKPLRLPGRASKAGRSMPCTSFLHLSTSAFPTEPLESGVCSPTSPQPPRFPTRPCRQSCRRFLSLYLILLSQRHQQSAAGSSRLLSSSSIQTCQQTFSVLVLRSPLQSGLKTANPPALQLCTFNSTASKLLQTSHKFLPLLTRNGYPSDTSVFDGEQYPAELFSTVWCLVFPSYPIVGW